MRILNRPIVAIRFAVATSRYVFLMMSAEKTSCNDAHNSLNAFSNPLIASSVPESESRTKRARGMLMNTDSYGKRKHIPPNPSAAYHLRNNTHSYICLRITSTLFLYSGSSLYFPRAFTRFRIFSTVVQRSRIRPSRAICSVTIWSRVSPWFK